MLREAIICGNSAESSENMELRYDTMPPALPGSPNRSLNRLCMRQTRDIAKQRMKGNCNSGREHILRAYRDYAVKTCYDRQNLSARFIPEENTNEII